MKLCFQIALQSDVPVLFWGMPGVGKTAGLTAAARDLRYHLETLIALIHPPEDFSGLPQIHKPSKGLPAYVSMVPMEWALRVVREWEDNRKKSMVFFDEILCAPPLTRGALLRVILDKVVGELQLPACTQMVAAANPPEVSVGGFTLDAPLANRFCHLDWEVDNEAWIRGMSSGWASEPTHVLPENWRDHIPLYRTLVASYIKHRPMHLSVFPKQESERGRAWPSPRSWSNAATMLAATHHIAEPGEGNDARIELVRGCVGPVGLEFNTWLRDANLPDPMSLLQKPSLFKVHPNRDDINFAILSSVSSTVLQKKQSKWWVAMSELMAIAAKAGKPDCALGACGPALAGRSSMEGGSAWVCKDFRDAFASFDTPELAAALAGR